MKADLDRLVTDCQAALAADRPQTAMREALQRYVDRPTDLAEALPAPRQQSALVHVSRELTIMQVVNGPGFVYLPHDHGSWSACAFYAGRERNTFYRRTPTGLECSGGKEYGEGDVVLMGTEVIHMIENPLRSNNAALHVFAGNPFTATHSQWDIETLAESGFDGDYAQAVYPMADEAVAS